MLLYNILIVGQRVVEMVYEALKLEECSLFWSKVKKTNKQKTLSLNHCITCDFLCCFQERGMQFGHNYKENTKFR